jgi:hypothetical protein
MSDNSPVPEWFGRTEEERRAATTSRTRTLGCGLLVFFALLAAGAGYWAFDSRARADRLERDLAEARQRAKEARDPLPAAPPPVPEPEVAPSPVEEPPEEEAPVGEPADSGAALDARSAQQVIRSLSPAFRKCFNDALAEDPNSDGRLNVKVRIAPTGDVSSVETTQSGHLSPAVGNCVAAKVRGAKFPASGAPTSLDFPVTFVAQR